ncbi:Cna B-type domain-containing protein [Anaerovorax odorimutans]|uniref:Cna B-type domain-containing protein n=1 Tax=Anaerovorax odorimutans TaxID=109327 RepID=A0ABT1RJT6_9FIRM|nr:Cna B-type domain-containing protein [Anaerovorax odorimutans]MCQ4635451.1 Cna B-type domain-containing protein [Anaerovorax odorimutans]
MKGIRKKRWRRIVAIMTVVAMAFIQATPVSAAASKAAQGSEVQITDASKNVQTFENGDLKIDKYIQGTDTENVFNITLDVTTTERLDEIPTSADAAVVLVMDASNSMSDNYVSLGKSRAAAAASAAKNFVDAFGDVEGTPTSKRLVKLVQFASNAEVKNGWNWENVISAEGKKASKDDIGSITWFKNNNLKGGTNIEGGLQLAYNVINAAKKDDTLKGIENVNVILLTDGCPTYHIADSADRDATNEIAGTRGGGDVASWEDHNSVTRAGGIAEKIKNLKVNDSPVSLYSIAFAIGDAEFQNANGKYEEKNVYRWLSGFSSKAFKSTDTSGLMDNFKTILELIKLGAEAWYVTDPMAENIIYQGKSSQSGTDKNNAFTYSNGTKKLLWDIKNSPRTEKKEGNKTYYTYTLTYPVALDTTKENFEFNKAANTNGNTDLAYFMFSKANDDGVESELKYQRFHVPAVKGLAGAFSFQKVKEDGKTPLAGATFTLSGKATGSKKDVVLTAESKDGTVSFNRIPAGNYTLQETKVPDGYQTPAEDQKHSITVSYGEVTIDGKPASEFKSVANTPKPVELKVKKTIKLEKSTSKDEIPENLAFVFNLYKNSGTKDNPQAEGNALQTLTITAKELKETGLTFEKAFGQKVGSGEYVIIEKASQVPVGWKYDTKKLAVTVADGKAAYKDRTNEFKNKFYGVTDVTATKTWKSAGFQDKTVPESVQFELWQKIGGQESKVNIENNPATLTPVQAQGGTKTWNETTEVKWENLPKFLIAEDGTAAQIQYFVKEIKIEDDDADNYVSNVDKSGLNVTNEYKKTGPVPEISKALEKAGTDAGTIPKEFSFEFKLYNKDNQVIGSAAVTDDTQVKDGVYGPVKFVDSNKNPVKLDKGEYTIKETPVYGWKTAADIPVRVDQYGDITYNGKTSVTAANTWLGLKDVEAQKQWDDKNNQDNVRPGEIILGLKKGGQLIDKSQQTVTVNKNGDPDTAVWENLPVYNPDKTKIKYTVVEFNKDGQQVAQGANYNDNYVATYDGLTVTNTHQIYQTKVTVKKDWVNDGNQAPEGASVKVQLYAVIDKVENEVKGKVITLSAANEWQGEFTGLDKNKNGEAIAYTVKEVEAPAGYDAHVETTAKDGEFIVKLTNAKKADKTAAEDFTFGADNELTYTINFNNYKNDKADIAITDTIDAKTSYVKDSASVTISGAAQAAEPTVSGQKLSWEFKDVASKASGTLTYKVKVKEDAVGDIVNAADVTVDNDPKVDVKAKTTINDVDPEKDVTDGTVSVNGKAVNIGSEFYYTVTYRNNTDKKADITIEDKLPDGLTYADEESVILGGATLAKSGYEFDSSAGLFGKEGKDLQWTIKDVPSGKSGIVKFKVKVTKDAKDKLVNKALVNHVSTNEVTNTVVPDTGITVQKVWNDSENQDGVRPDNVTVQLQKKSGVSWSDAGDPQTLNSSNQWTKNWDVPLYEKDDSKTPIEYRVIETKVGGAAVGDNNQAAWTDAEKGKIVYRSKVESSAGQNTTIFTVTNSYEAKKTEIKGKKTWVGDKGSAVTMTLQKKVGTGSWTNVSGQNNQPLTAVASETSGWKYSFGEQPVYEKGTKIQYRVVETVPEGYFAGYEGYDVTNAQKPEKEVTAGTTEGKFDFSKNPDKVLIYKISFHNPDGDNTKVTIVDTIDSQVSYKAGTAKLTLNGTESQKEPSINGNKLTWTIDNVAKGASGNITYQVNVKDTAVGEIENGADVTINDHKATVTTKTPIIPVIPEKTTTAGDLNVGDELTYEITYKNNAVDEKNKPAEAVVTITDMLPKGLSYVDDSATTGGNIEKFETKKSGDVVNLIWTTKKLAPGTSGTVSFKATVNADAVDSVTNQVEVKDPAGTYKAEPVTNPVGDTVSVSVEKQWMPKAPAGAKVTVDLYRAEKAGAEPKLYQSKELSEENWSHTFTGLPKFVVKGGELTNDQYIYTVKERSAIDGYISTVQKIDDNQFTITNSKPAKTAKATAKPDLSDNERYATVGENLPFEISYYNADKDANITVTDELQKGLEYTANSATVTINGAGAAYTEKIESLASGAVKVTWTIEKAAKGNVKVSFDAKVTEDAGQQIKNTGVVIVGDDPNVKAETEPVIVTPLIDVKGTKVWADGDDQFKTRPDSVEVTLFANGKATDQKITVTADKDWAYEFKDLPLYDGATKLSYTVKETKVGDQDVKTENGQEKADGYVVTYNGNNITNTLDDYEAYSWDGSIKVTKKVTADGNPQKVTDTFYVALFSDEDCTVRAKMPDPSVEGQGGDINIPVQKIEIKGSDSGTAEFKGIPVGTVDNPVTYYIAEVADESGQALASDYEYKASVQVDGKSGNMTALTVKNHDSQAEVTNAFDNQTSVNGIKNWANDTFVADMFRPDSITVKLLQNGNNYQEKTVRPDESGNWAYSFDKLPKFDKDGNLYQYTIDEAAVDGYAVTAEGMDLTNTLEGYLAGSVSITKKVTLNGNPYNVAGVFYAGVFTDSACENILTINMDGREVPALAALPVDGTESQAVVIDGLPLGAGGEPVKYYIAETDSQGNAITAGNEFTISIDNPEVTADARGTKAVTITNEYAEKAALTGTKTWNDDNNAGNKRPDSIKVTLLQNGKVYRDPITDSALVKTITAKDDWTYSFVNLPGTDSNGKAYEYSVIETGAEADYTAEVNGMNITNTLNVEQFYYEGTIDITKKTMLRDKAYNVDDVYYAGIFTDSDYTKLLKDENGEDVIYAIALDNESEATIKVPVPAGAKGEAVTYYVTEVDEYGTPVDKAGGQQYTCEVKGGVCSVKGGDTENVTFVNTYQVKKVPQTGDDSNILWLMLLMTLAAIAMVYAVLRRRAVQKKS